MYPHRTPLRQLDTRRTQPHRELRSTAEQARTAGPPRYKLALLTWAGAYTLITLFLAVLGPAIASWPLALRTFVLSATMVVALTWLVMPRLTRLFRGWLDLTAPPGC